MFDFRIIISAIIVCVSLVMVGTRILSDSDAFNVAAGSRAGVRTMSDTMRPAVGVTSTTPAPDLPTIPTGPAIAARPTPLEPVETTSSINPSEYVDRPARRSVPAAPSPPIQSRAPSPPVPEITGSIYSHPEAQPNVEPDWRPIPPRRTAAAPASSAPTPARHGDDHGVFEFLFKNAHSR
jgi:hypothetical protein